MTINNQWLSVASIKYKLCRIIQQQQEKYNYKKYSDNSSKINMQPNIKREKFRSFKLYKSKLQKSSINNQGKKGKN